MRRILAIIRKDIVLRFSGWAEWLFFLILPIAFTFVLAGGTGAPSDPRVQLIVVDQANSPLSAQLIAALGQSEAVRPRVLPLPKAEDAFSKRQVAAVLIIPAGFDLQHLREGKVELELRQQPNNTSALVAFQAVGAAAGRIDSALAIAASSVAEAERIGPFASESANAGTANTWGTWRQGAAKGFGTIPAASTPFIAATYGLPVPKSVVRVMTANP